MRLSEIGELTLLEIIRNRFAHQRLADAKKSKGIIVGIGDDAAVIKSQGKNLLVTTDMMVEGIHFDISLVTPYQLGFKLVSINVSDIYAMGGIPRYLLLGIAMNKNTEKSFIDRFLDGVQDSMKLYNVSLIGGDMSSSKKDMVVTASLIGYAERPVKRSGARPGDRIYVTGNLGDSACGFELLKRIKKPVPIGNTPSLPFNSQLSKLGLTWNLVKPLLKRHLMPEARNPGDFVKHATAMIDLSDGLFIDLSRLCNESRVGARLYREHIPVSHQMKKALSVLGKEPFKLATSGGEDYELLFTAPSTSPIPPLLRGEGRNRLATRRVKITPIGEITKSGKTIVDKKGRETSFSPEGYQHFGIQG